MSVQNSLYNFPVGTFGSAEQRQEHLVPFAAPQRLAYRFSEGYATFAVFPTKASERLQAD